jgi:type III secretion system HrpE/YscL family protein
MRVIREAASIRVVPRVLPDARREAEAIVQTAREEAAALLEAARREVESLRAEARREGLQLGQADASALHVREAARRAEQAAQEAEAVGQLAVEVARAILGREAAAGPEVLRDVVQRTLARVRRARRIVLRVHPADVAMAREASRTWLPAGMEPELLEVESDASVDRGGVVVESELGRLDARLETQLGAIARALAGR